MNLSKCGLIAAATAAALALAACNNTTVDGNAGGGLTLGNPDSLTYQLTRNPAGVLLTWGVPSDPNVTSFAVYGRDSTSTSTNWTEIGVTVSNSYHLTLPIDTEYYVASQDNYGDQSTGSPEIVLNFADSVQTPGDVRGTPYNGAVTIGWDSIAQVGYNASRFQYYTVYSTPYTGTACDTTSIAIEGTTVSTGFVITSLPNGTSRCYTITSVSLSGLESPFASPFVVLTPASGDPILTLSMVPPRATVVSEHRRRR